VSDYDAIPGANRYGLPKQLRRELEAEAPKRLCVRCGGWGEKRIFNPETILPCPDCDGTGRRVEGTA
jgi:hypothetical protein